MPTSSTALQSFSYRTTYARYRKNSLKLSAYKRLTKQALPLFFRGGDIISYGPLANGVYEPDIKALIDHLSSNGYGNFLIDIGANIGLSSCQSGAGFQEIHMFEPNPNCLSILKVNTKIALRKHNYVIHEYGLGSQQETLQLFVPYDNWGGGFVKSKSNDYDEALLSSKDGYGKFDLKNYDVLDVAIESASEKLAQLFASLAEKKLCHGVIKIDVEGFEKLVIDAILATCPAKFNAFVIFENWKEGGSLQQLQATHSRINTFKLTTRRSALVGAPRWLNSCIDFFKGGHNTTLVPIAETMTAGTYVMEIKNA
jgi:FkbM family methyltransferase